jgi:hypothetical protein
MQMCTTEEVSVDYSRWIEGRCARLNLNLYESVHNGGLTIQNLRSGFNDTQI